MSITDKELLTFCNLANLEMEYANLQYDEDLDTGETIKRNHTIYTIFL